MVSLGTSRSRDFFLEQERSSLQRLSSILSEEVRFHDEMESIDFKALARHFSQTAQLRVTFIKPNGTVLADSHQDPSVMDNHGQRPEVLGAIEYSKGSSSRYSLTLKTRMMYSAQRVDLSEQSVILRLAHAIPELDKEIQKSVSYHFYTAMVVFAVGCVVVYLLTKRVTTPIENLTREVHKISHGLRDEALTPSGSLELCQLTDAINLMFQHAKDRITTIVQQRNLQESILTSMKEGVISLDHQGRIATINPKARHILYCSPNVDIIGRDLAEICRNGTILNAFHRLKNEELEFDIEVHLDSLGDSVLQARGCAIQSNNHLPNHFLIVLNDITHLRRLETMRRDFVANVSHELKTPLTSIRGYSETLSGMPALKSEEIALRFLEKIELNADRLHRIIEDLLTLSRIEQSGLSLDDLKGLSTKAICDQLIRELPEPLAQRVSIPVQHPNKKVLAHGPLLHQALFNLIENGLKYSGQDGVVEVTIDDLSDRLAINIHDNGPGIPEKHLPMLTQRFYRVDKARSRDKGGTGLGLSIVKHIAEAHHGELKISSKVGEGSTFSLILPTEQETI